MYINIFDDQQLGLLEDIFQINARPDGSTNQKTSMEMQISYLVVVPETQEDRKTDNFAERNLKRQN